MDFNRIKDRVKAALWVAVAAAAGAAAVTALLVNIFERKQEARNPFFRVVELDEQTQDPSIWGKDFPFQYDGYLRTSQMRSTRFGGSEAIPHAPTSEDPRKAVSRSKIEADIRLKTLWAGYSFAKDFRERRGHAYMLEDQMYTGRQKADPPAHCINCHASIVVPFRKLGNGDLRKGFERLDGKHYAEARALVQHPIACIDCHDPKTMALRVTRPAFLEGLKAYKASLGVKGYDPNTMATRQEMRTFVCGQCHVNYYFHGPEKRLAYPWSKGLSAEDALAHLDADRAKDWVHADTGANALKARHPEFELWSQGVHARAGVACADCHMPYKREGAMKVSDHHVQSPLLNINRACQTCHKFSEAELKARVDAIQVKNEGLRSEALDAVVALIGDLKKAKAQGRKDPGMRAALDLQRKAGFLVDFVSAENSSGFHAPQEAARLLGRAMDLARQGQIALRDASFMPTEPVTGP
ncbi:MAG: ammonia-forming cytochrome c nitrite reductase subunit c552 [Elusimicrobiota bacterium]|jgi:nitrite reductase (cytochrome c-552)